MLKPHTNRDGKITKYHYRDKPEGDVIEASVYYTKGGANFLSGNQTRRGIFIDFYPCRIEKRESGITMKSFALFDNGGLKFLVMPLARMSDRHLAAAVQKFNPYIEQLVELWRTNKPEAIRLVQVLIKEFNGQ